jgi:putative acetyltransferase
LAPEVIIRLAENEADFRLVRGLWQEYWTSLGLPDDFQGFRHELEGLPGVYGRADGALFLAWREGEAIGTIALRRFNDVSGEVKRLYVRSGFRGLRLGQRLMEAVMDRAVVMKYQVLYADTLPSMREALSLYDKLGFERVEAYSDTPTAGAIFLRKNITARPL